MDTLHWGCPFELSSLESLLNSSLPLVAAVDGNIVAVNTAFLDLVRQSTSNSMVGRPISEVLTSPRLKVSHEGQHRLQAVDHSGELLECVFRCEDGTLLNLEGLLFSVSASQRGLNVVVLGQAGNGSSGRKELEFQTSVLSQLMVAIVTIDPLGIVTYWNAGAEQIYGVRSSDAKGQLLQKIVGYESLAVLTITKNLSQLPLNGVWREEHVHQGHDSEEMWIELSIRRLSSSAGCLSGYLIMICDISERRRADEALKQKEEQLRQSQKMEAIGKLAGGVAHDFNNLLTAIMGYSEMLLKRLETGDPARSDVEEIKRAGTRAAELTSQLLAFSRKQVLKKQVLDLNSVVLGMDKLLRRLIGAHIELVTVLDPDLAAIESDRGQIEQVILNLVVNARDAMEGGGQLTIQTMNVHQGLHGSQWIDADIVANGGVVFVVSDTGHGMSPETQAHIFEPFYTTKQHGKGTGLGLSTVYGIVEQSGGTIRVESERQRGSTFRIFFPTAEIPQHLDRQEHSDEELSQGSETILVAEDERLVRTLVHQILKRAGYRVLEAQNGAEALRLAIQHQGKLHLLLTDVVMPLMGGPDLAKKLCDFRKETKVLFMSGYTDDAAIRQGNLDPRMAFIQKPFTPVALTQKIREVLDRTHSIVQH